MTRCCLDCNKPLVGKKRYWVRFCGASCKKAFHRRRERRGAAMYDLVMAWRFDRTDTGPEALAVLCEMAASYRDEDKEAGRRRSWLTLKENADKLTPYRHPGVTPGKSAIHAQQRPTTEAYKPQDR